MENEEYMECKIKRPKNMPQYGKYGFWKIRSMEIWRKEILEYRK